ncbi:LexA family transcriptional regulator [Sphingomonas sp. UYP23]
MTNAQLRDAQLIDALARATGLSPSDIAVKAGIAASTLTRVVKGQSRLSVPTVEKLQARFPGFFGELDDIVDSGPSEYIEVEVLPSYAGMGGGGTGEGEPGRALLPRQLIEERLRGRPDDFLLIDVRGDSMEDDFFHGDQILIDKRDRDPSQPGPFCLHDGDAYVVKLVERVPRKRGFLRIFSANTRYNDYEVDEGEIHIIGRPSWFARAL